MNTSAMQTALLPTPSFDLVAGLQPDMPAQHEYVESQRVPTQDDSSFQTSPREAAKSFTYEAPNSQTAYPTEATLQRYRVQPSVGSTILFGSSLTACAISALYFQLAGDTTMKYAFTIMAIAYCLPVGIELNRWIALRSAGTMLGR